MIIYTINILAAPLVLLIWALDLYVMLAVVRLILGRFSGERASQLCSAMQSLTDPPLRVVERWLLSRNEQQIRPWVPWVIVLVCALICRHLAAWLIIRAM